MFGGVPNGDELEAPEPMNGDNEPIFAYSAHSVVHPKRARPEPHEGEEDDQEYEEGERWCARTEPPEVNLRTLLTENMTDYRDRWEAVAEWDELFESPHHRAVFYSLMEQDFRTCLRSVSSSVALNIPEQVMSDVIGLYVHTTWKLRFQKDFRKRKKKASKAEGALGEESMQQERLKYRDKVTIAFEHFVEETDAYWEAQHMTYELNTEKCYHTEAFLLWQSRVYLCLCERGLRGPSTHTTPDTDPLLAFQNVYPSMGSVSQHGTSSVYTYKQGKLLQSAENLWQNWTETPYSECLMDYVECLLHRYAVLGITVFQDASRLVLDCPGMYHESTEMEQRVPCATGGAPIDLGMEYVGTGHIGDGEEETRKIQTRSASQAYMVRGMLRLCPMIQTVDLARRFVWPRICEDGRPPMDSRIPQETWREGMRGFLRYARRIVCDNLTTREYIRDMYRLEVYDHMMKPGEAVNFSSRFVNESFNPYNIVNRLRIADVERLDKYIVSAPVEKMLTMYGERLEKDESNVPKDTCYEDAFRDSRNAWIALQAACLQNFFDSSFTYKKGEDLVLMGPQDDVLMFLSGYFGSGTTRPVICLPRVFRIAGSYMVYLPWTGLVVKMPGILCDFEGGLASGVLLAMWELRQHIRHLKNRTKMSPTVKQEAKLLGNFAEQLMETFFDQKDET